MTKEQKIEAIEQMKVHCELKMPDYELLCARGTLYTLGFHGEECEEVLDMIFDSGFTNCLDPKFPVKGIGMERAEYPSPDVCYWGPDQLKSRLDSLFIR